MPLQVPGSTLWVQHCSGRWETQARELDDDGAVFLDLNPYCFGKLLSGLRLIALAKTVAAVREDKECSGGGGGTKRVSVHVEPNQLSSFKRMLTYMQIEESLFLLE